MYSRLVDQNLLHPYLWQMKKVRIKQKILKIYIFDKQWKLKKNILSYKNAFQDAETIWIVFTFQIIKKKEKNF